jgi:hypothetical protein
MKAHALTVSRGCSKDVERALAKPPARADFKTDPAGTSTGGAMGTTVAASNHTILYHEDGILQETLWKMSCLYTIWYARCAETF